MRDLEHFEVVGRTKQVVVACYRLASHLPDSERFGLISQMNRAAVSMAANVAEGIGRGTQGELERHLRISQGSAAELRVLTDLAAELHQLPEAQTHSFVGLLDSVRKQLTRLTMKVAAER
jgi:four helix bundle protein